MTTLTAPLFGSKHLLGLLGLAILFLVFSRLLSRKREQKPKTMILVFTILFYVLEIIKLSYIIWLDGSFPIYHLPFHLCSIPLYLYPLMLFLKEGTLLNKYIKPTAYAVILLAGIVALAMPTTIIGNAINWFPLSENILPLVSFLFHGLMIFSSIYLIRSRYYAFQSQDFIRALSITFAFAVIAMTVNHFLDTDFMLLNTGSGSPLQFLIEYGKGVYLAAMMLLGVALIGLNFFVTEKILVAGKNSQKLILEN
ncbi:MAG: YwaF family protein [Bacilli bacterium]|nr:YwaF family protein [Bacilli bacterium]